MRSGRLLAEESPDNLLRNYRLPSLEEVFLKLCMKDDGENRTEPSQAIENCTNGTLRSVTGTRQPVGGHTNLAFDHSTSQTNITEIDTIENHCNSNESSISPADCFGVRKIIVLVFFCFFL